MLLAEVKGFVQAIVCKQFLMSSLLNDLSFLQHNNFVKREERKNTLCDNNGGLIFQIIMEIDIDLLFCTGIHRVETVIKNDNVRLSYQSSSNGYPIILTFVKTNPTYSKMRFKL